MASDFLFSLNVVLPLFLCCLVGFFARRIGLVTEAFLTECSHIVFYIAIPANIFLSLSGDDLARNFRPSLLLYVCGVIVLLSVVCGVLIPRVIHSRAVAATMTVTILRGNFAMLGIPLALSLMGAAEAGPTLVMIPFATMLYTVVSVLLLIAMGEQGTDGAGKSVRNALVEIIRNPLIIASAASIAVALLGIRLPVFLTTTIGRFADMTTGLALFMLGAQLNIGEAFRRMRYTIPAAILRLIVLPLLVVLPAIALGYRGAELGCIFIFFATPTAVNSYILADRMGGDGKLAGDIVLITSCFSSVTMLIGIFLLKIFQLI